MRRFTADLPFTIHLYGLPTNQPNGSREAGVAPSCALYIESRQDVRLWTGCRASRG